MNAEPAPCFDGISVWEPNRTAIELVTSKEHAPFVGDTEVALYLSFTKLEPDRVEVSRDASPVSS